MNNNNYRYQLERYRGRGSRYTSPQCGRKQSFTRYIDTYNNNIYINDNVGKCNRLDKCGYHYTPKQYYTDNPWKEEKLFVCRKHRVIDKQTMSKPQPHGITPLPRWFMEQTLGGDSTRARGFSYRVSSFMEGREQGADIADLSIAPSQASSACALVLLISKMIGRCHTTTPLFISYL